MSDNFETYSAGLSSPASDIFAITPNDNADLEFVTRAIEVLQEGNIACVLASGRTITKFFGAGYHPVRVRRVLATGTTATGLYGLV